MNLFETVFVVDWSAEYGHGTKRLRVFDLLLTVGLLESHNVHFCLGDDVFSCVRRQQIIDDLAV